MNKNYLFCFLAIFLFSTIELVGKMIDKSVSPIAITCYRFFIGSVMLFIVYFIKGRRIKINIYDFLNMCLVGILNVCVSMYMLQLGIYYGQASLSAIIISSNPIFVGIFALVILKEKFGLSHILCWIFGIIGLSLVIFGQYAFIDDSINLSLGVMFSVLAAVTFGLYTVLSKAIILKNDILLFNAISFLAGGIVLFIMGLVSKQQMLFVLDIRNVISVLYLGVFVTGIAYMLFFEGLSGIKTVSGSVFFLLKPVFASILAIIFLKESLSFLQILGVMIVIISLVLATNIKKMSFGKINYLFNFKYFMNNFNIKDDNETS